MGPDVKPQEIVKWTELNHTPSGETGLQVEEKLLAALKTRSLSVDALAFIVNKPSWWIVKKLKMLKKYNLVTCTAGSRPATFWTAVVYSSATVKSTDKEPSP